MHSRSSALLLALVFLRPYFHDAELVHQGVFDERLSIDEPSRSRRCTKPRLPTIGQTAETEHFIQATDIRGCRARVAREQSRSTLALLEDVGGEFIADGGGCVVAFGRQPRSCIIVAVGMTAAVRRTHSASMLHGLVGEIESGGKQRKYYNRDRSEKRCCPHPADTRAALLYRQGARDGDEDDHQRQRSDQLQRLQIICRPSGRCRRVPRWRERGLASRLRAPAWSGSSTIASCRAHRACENSDAARPADKVRRSGRA
jgi:hypothetical protein